ncbi:hypothetical protein [Blastococcus brunescens]|uniref:N-acetyltransferase domain-containing protein n=1 Tax=Blastococcus brunescens TaxID=1564165 RepID=A0ABZ1AVF4_9ACTN|nr:hypothetical protein [Blastococcus sp. BMG 8361]WRL62444.1 hypothetical protein U6N30_20810 [Blastococcus sp. BMG 8361]
MPDVRIRRATDGDHAVIRRMLGGYRLVDRPACDPRPGLVGLERPAGSRVPTSVSSCR